jgi:hypothetical protein
VATGGRWTGRALERTTRVISVSVISDLVLEISDRIGESELITVLLITDYLEDG